MRIKELLSVLILTCLFSACGSDDAEEVVAEYRGQLSHLKQTYWSGTMTRERGEKSEQMGKVDIMFLTDERGNSAVERTDLDNKMQTLNFTYEVDVRLITIRGENDSHYLNGDWMLVKEEANRLVLVRGVNYRYSRTKLDLTRVYF